jgi:hypothetical protein
MKSVVDPCVYSTNGSVRLRSVVSAVVVDDFNSRMFTVVFGLVRRELNVLELESGRLDLGMLRDSSDLTVEETVDLSVGTLQGGVACRCSTGLLMNIRPDSGGGIVSGGFTNDSTGKEQRFHVKWYECSPYSGVVLKGVSGLFGSFWTGKTSETRNLDFSGGGRHCISDKSGRWRMS